jgi:DNA repair protein RadA/Sms
MAKIKTTFFCQNCGAQSPKWMGKCPSCGEWNTYVEEVIQKEEKRIGGLRSSKSFPSKPEKINEITWDTEKRMHLRDNELNRVLGGGLVKGSVILLGGEPGIGKSTLMLQVALNVSGSKCLYITGEESKQQIRMRAERIGINNELCSILTETVTQNIFPYVENDPPDLIVIDSIQTLTTQSIDASAGSVSQIRECTAEWQQYAKTTQIPVILIGHITKEGSIAGPKILEHMVDAVLQFEGDRNYGYRILRSMKNRFGSTSELGIYEMQDNGMREVSNPSEILLSPRDEDVSGIAIAATIEGLRPMLIETQALVSTAAYGTPQRTSTGFDNRRLNMLLAVLEKRSGFKLGSKDVFLNIAGGIRVDDPAIDLAVVASVLSSNEDHPISGKNCFAGEVGLSGEIRPVSRIESRIAEAEKMGFEKIFVSHYNQKKGQFNSSKLQVVPIKKIENLWVSLFR